MKVLNNVTMTAERVINMAQNPDLQKMDAWKVCIKYNNKQFTTDYFMGYGHKGKAPNKMMVLEALTMDANTAEQCETVEDIMAEFGYEDRQQAQRILKACQKIQRNLNRLFTEKELEELQDDFEEFYLQ